MAYADENKRRTYKGAPHGGRRGPQRSAYLAAVEVVRQRAKLGEACFFCGEGFDWAAHHNSAAGFTAHHLDRLMEGGAVAPSPERMKPAHRGCNSRDGLKAQNARRRGVREASQPPERGDRTSRDWFGE